MMQRLSQSVARRVFSTSALRDGGRVKRGLWKPAAFTVLVGGVSYGVSGAYAVGAKERWLQQYQMAEDWGGGITQQLKRLWWNIGAANRFTCTIVGVNVGVFLLWRVPAVRQTMEKYFLSSIASRSTLPILLSEFSHIELWHLGLNMVVLWSFAPALLSTLGSHMSSFNAWPYYLTGGAFASMVGYYAKFARGSAMASLGASGALMAVVSLVVFNNPDASVFLIFLPFIPIPAGWALAGIVAMDTIGLIRGWRFFDHAGHLGGVAFAALYQTYLHKVCVNWQLTAAQKWSKWNTGNKRIK